MARFYIFGDYRTDRYMIFDPFVYCRSALIQDIDLREQYIDYISSSSKWRNSYVADDERNSNLKSQEMFKWTPLKWVEHEKSTDYSEGSNNLLVEQMNSSYLGNTEFKETDQELSAVVLGIDPWNIEQVMGWMDEWLSKYEQKLYQSSIERIIIDFYIDHNVEEYYHASVLDFWQVAEMREQNCAMARFYILFDNRTSKYLIYEQFVYYPFAPHQYAELREQYAAYLGSNAKWQDAYGTDYGSKFYLRLEENMKWEIPEIIFPEISEIFPEELFPELYNPEMTQPSQQD